MFKNHLKRMLFFMVVIGLAGWLYAVTLPKLYEAKIDIRAGSQAQVTNPNLPEDLQRNNLQNDLDTDVGILRSVKIFSDGLTTAAQNLNDQSFATSDNLTRLFPMYEVNVPAALNQYGTSTQRVIQVRVRAETPQRAAELANGVGYAFTAYRRQAQRAATEDTATDLRKRVQVALANSKALENKYEEVKRRNAVPDSQAKAAALVQALEQLRSRRDDATAQLAGSRSQIAELQAKLAVTPRLVPGGSNTSPDTAVDIAKGEVSRARVEYEALSAQFQDDATQVVEARRVLERAETRQRAEERRQVRVNTSQTTQQNPAFIEVQSALTQAQAAAAGLQSQIAEYNAAIAVKLDETRLAAGPEVELQRLIRDREISDRQVTQYKLALTGYENDTTSTNRQGPIIASATPDTIKEPVAPEVRRWAILSLFAGALLGLAYSFAIESLRLPVHTSWQLAELTALPVSAAVPAIPKPLARRHEAAIREGSFKPIESFRYMAFSLLARENKPRTVMFAGVGGDVGASSAAAEFAVATARTGAKTILVDCDLRSPQLSTLFGLAGRTGVSDVLGRTVLGGDSADLLVATEHEGLMVLPAGTSIEAGLADFQTQHIQGLLNDLAARADVVVLDLPAVDVFSDAARLAQYVDEACLVVSAKTTSYRSIPMAQEIMEKAGARSMSIVLTNASANDEPFGTRVSDSLVRA